MSLPLALITLATLAQTDEEQTQPGIENYRVDTVQIPLPSASQRVKPVEQIAPQPPVVRSKSQKEELETTHARDLLEITNEKLRSEIEFLAREYHDSERMNTVYALAAGGAIALVFFVLGFWFGSRRSSKDRYL